MKKTNDTNRYDLKVGDSLTWTNKLNYEVKKVITEVSENSCYSPARESWGTINGYIEKNNATITRN